MSSSTSISLSGEAQTLVITLITGLGSAPALLGLGVPEQFAVPLAALFAAIAAYFSHSAANSSAAAQTASTPPAA